MFDKLNKLNNHCQHKLYYIGLNPTLGVNNKCAVTLHLLWAIKGTKNVAHY